SLRPDSTADTASAASSAEFALIIASGASAYGALALARPNVAHLGMFLAVCGMCVGVHEFAKLWLSGSFEVGQPQVDLPIAFSALFVAALVSVVPRRVTERRKDPARYGRAVLTTLGRRDQRRPRPGRGRQAQLDDRRQPGLAPDRRPCGGGRAPHPRESGPRDAVAA